jgi:hypothetical protein
MDEPEADDEEGEGPLLSLLLMISRFRGILPTGLTMFMFTFGFVFMLLATGPPKFSIRPVLIALTEFTGEVVIPTPELPLVPLELPHKEVPLSADELDSEKISYKSEKLQVESQPYVFCNDIECF